MIYEPNKEFIEFHRSRAILRVLRGKPGSGKTTAGINEVGYLLPKWIKDTYGITKTRWVVVSLYRRDLPLYFMYWFPQAKHTYSSGKILIKHSGMTVEILFVSGSASTYRWYKMPKDADGKRHKVTHIRYEYPKLMALEMTGYFVESADHLPELLPELRLRIGRFPIQCPCRFGIEEEN